MKILILTGDPELLATLVAFCNEMSYSYYSASTRRRAASLLLSWKCDCVLLDSPLVGHIIRRILNGTRIECGRGNVIALGDETLQDEKTVGFPCLYLTKPFFNEELDERIQLIMRREKKDRMKAAVFGNVRSDPEKREVIVDGKALELTNSEFKMLHCLLLHGSVIVSRQSLIEQTWGSEEESEYLDALSAHLVNLRRKLRVAGANFKIRNVYAVGYSLTGSGL